MGSPDGSADDVDGGVWVGLWGGSAVHRYGPDGRLDLVVDLPASNVTACAFGGEDMTELYITTSRLGLPDGAEPEAGSLFSFAAPIAGRSTGSYAG
jgi:sugar lactone lactonase YvrE